LKGWSFSFPFLHSIRFIDTYHVKSIEKSVSVGNIDDPKLWLTIRLAQWFKCEFLQII